MKTNCRTAIVSAAAIALSIAAASVLAQPHPMHGRMMQGMGHGAGAGGHGPMAGAVAMLTRQDAGSRADMALVHDMLMSHGSIKRTVTNLPDGIRTVTESDDPQVAQTIKAHVASMSRRLALGEEFNIFSTTLPVLFQNREKITSEVETTEKGVIVNRRSADPAVVAALQGHAAEVTELVNEGMVAMRRGMMTRMAMRQNMRRSGGGSDTEAAAEHHY